MDKQQELKTKPIYQLLIQYSIPAILSMMAASLYNTIDRAFIGGIPEEGALAISGLGVTMPLFTILGAFCVGIAVGGSTRLSIRLGEGKKEEAEEVLGNTVALEFVVSVVMFFVGLFWLEDILFFLGGSPDTIGYGMDYMSVIFFGVWFNLPGFALNSAIRAEGNPKLASAMLILSCFLNVILDPIFIFGLGMGIKGAALGTIICQLFTCLVSLYYFTLGKSHLKLRIKHLKIKWKETRGILFIALTPFFMELAAGSIHFVTNLVLQKNGGDLAIGGMTTITSICLMFIMLVFGLSQGMQTIIAYNYGAKEDKRGQKTLLLALVVATGILTLGWLLIQLAPEKFVYIFTKDEDLVKLAVEGLSIYSLSLPTIGVTILGTIYFQSVGKGKLSMVFGLLRQVILLIPILFILPNLFGLTGVWLSQPLADTLAMVVVGGSLWVEFKQIRKRTRRKILR